ncbi:MAG: DUF3696 domain-containing protein [Planctomycetaceae bacterium]
MIKSLSLTNFKSWQQIDQMRLAPITGLFGTNSSGKTSILQWLLLLKQTVTSSDRQQVLNLGDERNPVQLGTFKDIVFQHKQPGHLSWTIDWSLPDTLEVLDPERRGEQLFRSDEMRFESNVSDEDGRVFVESMGYFFDGHEFRYTKKETTKGKGKGYKLSVDDSCGFQFRRTPGRVWDLPSPVKCYGFPDQVNSYFQNTGFLTDFQLAFEELFNRLYYLGPLREYPRRQYTWGGAQPADMGERGEKVIDAILSSRQSGEKISRGQGKKRFTVEEYAAYWLKELGLISDFSIGRVAKGSNLYQVKVKKTQHSSEVLITDVGFGISQILPVIVLCYYVPEGSTVLLEQPEIHLHPSVQSGLADVFLDAMRTRKIQFIIESHSEHLLRRWQRRIAENNDGVSPEEMALYFCNLDETASTLSELDIDDFGNIRNWPKDFFGDEFGEIAAMTKAAARRKRDSAA